jgi:hypothetical protein
MSFNDPLKNLNISLPYDPAIPLLGIYPKECKTKEMVSKLKRPRTDWEKIFASYTSDKGLITRIYRELKKLNSPKINEPIKNGQLN